MIKRRAIINLSAAADGLVVSGAANQVIRVLQYTIVAKSANDVTWKSNATAISGLMGLAAGGVVSAAIPPSFPQGEACLFKTAPGENLNLGLGSATAVGGHLIYEQG